MFNPTIALERTKRFDFIVQKFLAINLGNIMPSSMNREN